MDDVTDRRPFLQLSPEQDREFRRTQAKYEAAYRMGEPRALLDALMHVWWSRQTLPLWQVPALGEAILKSATDDEAERFRERMRHVKRYNCVHALRQKLNPKTGKNYTKDEALDRAVKMLKRTTAKAARPTIEGSYLAVRRDLERRGRESEFFYYVDVPDILIVDLAITPGDR